MDLVIDQGNSYTKAGFYQNGELVELLRYPINSKLKRLCEYTRKKEVESCIISSVGRQMNWEKIISCKKMIFLSKELDLGISNIKSLNPEIGLDRLTAIGGASFMFPNQNVLIIDMGTCITFDFIDKDAFYSVGNISCGVQTRLNAMHSLTSALPLLHFEEPKEDTTINRTTTSSCMNGGVLDGIIGELNHVISKYEEKYDNFKIILTGGDSQYFANKLKNEIFARQNFLVECLYKILTKNYNKCENYTK